MAHALLATKGLRLFSMRRVAGRSRSLPEFLRGVLDNVETEGMRRSRSIEGGREAGIRNTLTVEWWWWWSWSWWSWSWSWMCARVHTRVCSREGWGGGALQGGRACIQKTV